VAEINPVDWNLIIAGRNALLCGPPAALATALAELRPHLRAPLHMWSGAGEWFLPSVSEGTLILEDVAACSPEQQHALLQWLDASAGPVQVITTIERSLWDLVERGIFLDRLYYRLNTVYFDLY
jgi:transcriptional regulator of aromatic amino acid metabolism